MFNLGLNTAFGNPSHEEQKSSEPRSSQNLGQNEVPKREDFQAPVFDLNRSSSSSPSLNTDNLFNMNNNTANTPAGRPSAPLNTQLFPITEETMKESDAQSPERRPQPEPEQRQQAREISVDRKEREKALFSKKSTQPTLSLNNRPSRSD